MNTTKLDFEKDVLQSELPVLVDFTAAWCGPCKAIAPVIEELAQEYEGRAKVLKVDVDENSDVAVKHGVMSIPALVVFKDGQEVERLVGAVPKKEIGQLIDRHL